VVCAAPAYLKTRGTPRRAEELTQHNCLTYAYFGKSLWHFERAGKTIGVPVSGNLSANESTVLLRAAVEGAGIVMQPVFSAAPLIANNQLVALVPQYKPQSLAVHGLYASRQHQPVILRTMLDFLVKWFAAAV
jgi:DNA-binding transcriptional LysR family regulator